MYLSPKLQSLRACLIITLGFLLVISAQAQIDPLQADLQLDRADRRSFTDYSASSLSSLVEDHSFKSVDSPLVSYYANLPGTFVRILDKDGNSLPDSPPVDLLHITESDFFYIQTTSKKFRIPGLLAVRPSSSTSQGYTTVYFYPPMQIVDGQLDPLSKKVHVDAGTDFLGRLHISYTLLSGGSSLTKRKFIIGRAVFLKAYNYDSKRVVIQYLPLGPLVDSSKLSGTVSTSKMQDPKWGGSFSNSLVPFGGNGWYAATEHSNFGQLYDNDTIYTFTSKLAQSYSTKGAAITRATTGYAQWQLGSSGYPFQLQPSLTDAQTWSKGYVLTPCMEVDWNQRVKDPNFTKYVNNAVPFSILLSGTVGYSDPTEMPTTKFGFFTQFSAMLPLSPADAYGRLWDFSLSASPGSHAMGITSYSMSLIRCFSRVVSGSVSYSQGGVLQMMVASKF